MQRFIVSLVSVVLFADAACPQTGSTLTKLLPFPSPGPPSEPMINIVPLPELQSTSPSLGVFASQHEQLTAHVAVARKEMAALEAQLVDPRRALRDSIEAMTGIEEELIRNIVSASGDTEFTHSIELFVSDLARMRNARVRQLSSSDTAEPRDAEKTRRQWLNKQDELRTAEMLLAAVEKQLETLRTDRELDRTAQDLTDLTKTIQIPTTSPVISPTTILPTTTFTGTILPARPATICTNCLEGILPIESGPGRFPKP